MTHTLTPAPKVVPAQEASAPPAAPNVYNRWVESLGIPLYRAYGLEDPSTIPLGWWDERQCNASVVQLVGQENLTEVRVIEIPPGKTTAPFRMGLDEIVLVQDGRGLSTVWAEGEDKKTFEWSSGSLFMLPANHVSQLGNAQGDRPARLFLFNYLPLALLVAGSPDVFFDSTHADTSRLYGDGASYAAAKPVQRSDTGPRPGGFDWHGNFFPDLKVWDKLENQGYRGGGMSVTLNFPHSPIHTHMAMFPPGTYKKAHRHRPGVVLIVLDGEGYSLMWPERGADLLMARWRSGSVVVPPSLWWHQHFNAGSKPARYLALHAAGLPGVETATGVESIVRNQIEFPDEDPQIRALFQEEVAKRGRRSLMPDEAYRDASFKFTL